MSDEKIISYTCDNGCGMFCWWYCDINQIKGTIYMERLMRILSMLDHSLETKKKRHIAGGILMSVSLLFGGLAITVVTLKTEENEDAERFIE